MILMAGDMELPAPVALKVDDEIIWSSATGRALDGTMIGDAIAEKKNLSIQWGIMPEKNCRLIKQCLIAGFFPIKFRDDGTDMTIDAYRGTLSKDAIGWLSDGIYWYRSVSVRIIQQ